MKIIAIYCSPSRGRNSDTMMDNFLIGIKNADKNSEIEIEKINLNEIYIENYSFKNSKNPTEKEKDFVELANKIKNGTDALIISTPTYNFSVPAGLKNFIDRIRFIALDLENKNIMNQPTGTLNHLKVYFIVSGGTPSWAQKILFFAFPPFWLRGVFLYYGAQCMGAFYSGDVRAFQNQSILNKCQRLGSKFANKLIKGKKHGILERIFWRPPQAD
jgi:FMN-dependent NADH-azoreductase